MRHHIANTMNSIKFAAACLLTVFVPFFAYAQSLPVGSVAIEDYYRRSQLSGTADTNISFTIRPLFPGYMPNVTSSRRLNADSNARGNKLLSLNAAGQTIPKKFSLSLLPFVLQTQFNSGHPYGWNDGPMIPAKGLQTLISPGIFVSYGPLSIQLKPEFVAAQNSYFDTFNKNSSAVEFAQYYNIYNSIDLPARFGTGTYTRAYWGQSSIRVNYKAVSFGLSTENLWWGPGIQNSLLMSNTAPGFPHLALNTLRPLQTPIGSFEAQAVAGNLSSSGLPPLEPEYRAALYVPKPNYWRYLDGIIFTWQPRWIPGLFLGFDHSSVYYVKDLDVVNDYIPLFFSDVSKGKSIRLTSVFMRWLWPGEHAEIYFEWGQYNNTGDLLQQSLAPDNQRAYTFGIRKLFPFGSSNDERIMLDIELTQLQENSITNILTGREWYVNQYIRQGYTNQGQELGAGIGPGGNIQTVNISWVKGLKKLGLQFQRYSHNNDLYYLTYAGTDNYSGHWVDLSLAAMAELNYKNLIFNFKLQAIKSLNYLSADPVQQDNAYNLQMQAGLTYVF